MIVHYIQPIFNSLINNFVIKQSQRHLEILIILNSMKAMMVIDRRVLSRGICKKKVLKDGIKFKGSEKEGCFSSIL